MLRRYELRVECIAFKEGARWVPADPSIPVGRPRRFFTREGAEKTAEFGERIAWRNGQLWDSKVLERITAPP
jgi:hypothetical protein